MMASSTIFTDLSRTFSKATGLIPHLLPLVEGIGLFGLEPRVRELASLAVARSRGRVGSIKLHQIIGKAAGLTEEERNGELEGLTPGELSAVSLALGTVSQPLPKNRVADPPDQHFTSEQIQQLQAVALAVELDCQVRQTAASLWPGILQELTTSKK